MDHRPSPDERGFFRHEERHRDEFHPVVLDREDFPILLLRPLGASHHHGNVGAVEIRIEQSDLGTRQRQCAGQICGDGRFADPALAAAHGNDMLDPGNEVVFRLGLLTGVGMFISHGLTLLCGNRHVWHDTYQISRLHHKRWTRGKKMGRLDPVRNSTTGVCRAVIRKRRSGRGVVDWLPGRTGKACK